MTSLVVLAVEQLLGERVNVPEAGEIPHPTQYMQPYLVESRGVYSEAEILRFALLANRLLDLFSGSGCCCRELDMINGLAVEPRA